MNKSHLIKIISLNTDIPVEVVKEVVEGVFYEIVEAVDEGEPVKIKAFGVFTAKEDKRTTVFNFHTNQLFKRKGKKRLHFMPCKSMKGF